MAVQDIFDSFFHCDFLERNISEIAFLFKKDITKEIYPLDSSYHPHVFYALKILVFFKVAEPPILYRFVI